MRTVKAPIFLLLSASLGLAPACGGAGEQDPAARPRKSLAVPTDQPWVSVAVDNHFHDIHVEDEITLSPERAFIVKNQGRNLHNVTIPEIDFDRDIRPGAQIEFKPVGNKMPPGTYNIVCKYHASEGMVGRIVVDG